MSLPLLIASVVPPPEAGGMDSFARTLLGITGWPIPRWMHPTQVTPSEVLSVYADVYFLWPEYTQRRPAAETRAQAESLFAPGRVAVLLGRETERAFQRRAGLLDFFQWATPIEGDEIELYALLPYPSTWNRLWNYAVNRRLGRQMLQRATEVTGERDGQAADR